MSLEAYFNKAISDQSSIKQFSVLLVNNSGQTEILDKKAVQIVNMEEDACTLSVPKKACSVGHSLTIYILPKSSREYGVF